MSEPKRLNCPECGRELKVTAAMVGKAVACPGCQKKFRIGGVAAETEEKKASVNELPPSGRRSKSEPVRRRRPKRDSSTRSQKPAAGRRQRRSKRKASAGPLNALVDINLGEYKDRGSLPGRRARQLKDEKRTTNELKGLGITGTRGMSATKLMKEIERGGRFVVYRYCVSIIALTFHNSSNIHFLKRGQRGSFNVFGYSLVSLVLGWWGIPWGPIYTIGSVISNFGGGTDVTSEVVHALREQGLR